MANVDAPFGFKPYRNIDGSAWNGATRKCFVDSDYATALYIGDPVILNTTLANKGPTSKYQTVIKASAGDGNYVFGVIVGIEPDPTNLSRRYIPAHRLLLREAGVNEPGSSIGGWARAEKKRETVRPTLR